MVRARAAMAQGPLLLSSSSYLLPTLRLERNETPQSLAQRLDNNNNIVENSPNSSEWCCPVILDVSALSPDGSPHFQSLPPGSFTEMVDILRQHGMQATGVTASNGNLSLLLEEEAAQAGLPKLWSPRTTADHPKFDVSQVLQLVRSKNEEGRSLLPAEVDYEEGDGNDELITNSTTEASVKEEAAKMEATEGETILEERQTFTTDTKSVLTNNYTPAPVPMEFSSSSSTVYHGSVRSGQQVMSSQGQSLVILGSVNSGGEVLSSGDIFVFGKLRGRAFAGLGATRDTNEIVTTSEKQEEDAKASARIVATSFDAELVSIGDVFTTIDNVENLADDVKLKAGQPVMVTLIKNNGANDDKQCLKFAHVKM